MKAYTPDRHAYLYIVRSFFDTRAVSFGERMHTLLVRYLIQCMFEMQVPISSQCACVDYAMSSCFKMLCEHRMSYTDSVYAQTDINGPNEDFDHTVHMSEGTVSAVAAQTRYIHKFIYLPSRRK